MKRILCLLFLILCGFSLIGGGTFLLSGCSSSQTENGGGGILRLRKMKTKKQKTSMKAKE